MQHAGIHRLHQTLTESDPLRLTDRILIKDTVRAVVLQPHAEAQSVLARYGLRSSQLREWKDAQGV